VSSVGLIELPVDRRTSSGAPPHRGRPFRSALALAAAGLLAACSSGDDPERGLDAIDTPAFEPDDATSTTAPVGEGTPSSTTIAAGEGPASPTTTAAPRGGDGGAPEAPPQRVSFDDPMGDAVGGLDDSPPG